MSLHRHAHRSGVLCGVVIGLIVAPGAMALETQSTRPPDAIRTDMPSTASLGQGGLLGGIPPPEPGPVRPAGGRLEIGQEKLPTPGRATAVAPRVSAPPSVDGLLHDTVWADATRITRFVQRNPVEGAPATEATEVYIAFDSDVTTKASVREALRRLVELLRLRKAKVQIVHIPPAKGAQ